ncbi:putative disease resistance protein RGA1 [Olea europaea var. sylvestris]|uniref:Disease resistance RPP13 1 n=1 Tax=Olea europaea subsp. europaea TaxID=158383 RepID=A0A8S0QVN8_OLEEU|nr:putative disease resistance protein RGA1 [Olea europaea var. sylvestris]CAA2969874.1 disease resistance RPP13 1 [Olea europaea subsp. europaea]
MSGMKILEIGTFYRPFLYGKPRSKIIVTSRRQRVAKILSSISVHHVTVLSDENALSLLAHHALGTKNFDVQQFLYEIGEYLVKRCKNLPLAVKAVGGILRTKVNPKDLEDITARDRKILSILSSLQTLSKLIVSKSSGLKLKDLGKLSLLQGEIYIMELQNVVNVQEVIDARLMHKPSLNKIRLAWSNNLDNSRNEMLEAEVPNSLKPQENLSSLEIDFYGGAKL